MKLKYYLRGLGAGILFTALVFSFIILPKQDPMTDEEVILRAKELGLVEQQESGLKLDVAKFTPTPIPEQTATPTTALTPTSSMLPTATPTEAGADAEMTFTPTPSITPTELVSSPTATVTPTTSVSPTATPTPAQSGTEILVEIVRGMTSEEFAAAVKQAGVITDAADFNRYLIINDYAEHIRVGTYRLWKGMTYLEIAEKVAGYN